MRPCPSPNFNERAANVTLSYVVLHYTDMKDAASALARLCDPEAEVSAHYVIAEDGSVMHLVDERYRAWHAGHSFWRGQRDLNSASIGIELANPGHSNGYIPFPDAQIVALEKLLRDIVVRHGLDPRLALLAHSDIAPGRKQDPGHLFPWRELAADGFGLWPQTMPSDYNECSADGVVTLLAEIGYDVSVPAEALLAFQRHFYPESLTGIADAESIARLRAIRRDLQP